MSTAGASGSGAQGAGGSPAGEAGSAGQGMAAGTGGEAGTRGGGGGAAATGAVAGTNPGGPPDALVFEFSSAHLDGWVAAGHAETIEAALDEATGEPAGSARISARMVPATTASFSRFLPAPLDFTNATIRVHVLLSFSAGPLWFEVFLLSGPLQSWSSSAAFELWPSGDWVILELPVQQVAADPSEVFRFGIQFGPKDWTSGGDLVLNVDHVTVD